MTPDERLMAAAEILRDAIEDLMAGGQWSPAQPEDRAA